MRSRVGACACTHATMCAMCASVSRVMGSGLPMMDMVRREQTRQAAVRQALEFMKCHRQPWATLPDCCGMG